MPLALKTKKKRSPLIGWTVTTVFLGVATIAGLTGLNYMTGIGPSTIVSALGIPASDDVNEEEVTPQQRATHATSPSHPRLISIPDINVKDARIFAVDLNSRGEVDTPKNIFDVGWYQESALAEESGVMLLDAHAHGETQPGVFNGISLLKPDMTIEVVNGDNTTYTYTVKDVRRYDIAELEGKNASKLSDPHPDAYASLHLITSSGKYIPALQTYDQRVVVRASQH